MDPPRCRPPSATGRIRPAHAQHPCHHRDAAVRPLLQHQPEPVLRQRLLAKKAAAFLGNPFSLPGSLMCLLAPPGSFCPSVLAWVAFPVLPYLMAQSLRVLSLVPGSAAHSLMLFFGSASRAFLQCPAASSRYSSACCLGELAFALDSAFSISLALTGISLLRSAGGDGRASRLSMPAAGSCHPAVHQKITAQGLRGDARVHEIPAGALAPHPHQQRHRTHQPRDQAPHEGGWHLPRREERAHAGDRQAQVRRRERVGVAPLPGRVAAARVAAPDGGPPTCQKVRKKLDGTQLACDSPVGQLLKLAALQRTPEQSL